MKEKLFDVIWPNKIFGPQLESIPPFEVFYTIQTDFDQQTTTHRFQLHTLFDLKLFVGHSHLHDRGVKEKQQQKGDCE